MRAAFCQILTVRRYGVVFLIIEFRKVRRRKTAEPFFFHRRRAQISARGTSHFVLVASGAGNFALRARCKWRGELRAPHSLQVARGTSLYSMHGTDAVSHLSTAAAYFCVKQKYGSERYKDVSRTATARNRSDKSRVEKRSLFLQRTAGMPCRYLRKKAAYFCVKQKYGSEGLSKKLLPTAVRTAFFL